MYQLQKLILGKWLIIKELQRNKEARRAYVGAIAGSKDTYRVVNLETRWRNKVIYGEGSYKRVKRKEIKELLCRCGEKEPTMFSPKMKICRKCKAKEMRRWRNYK